MSSYFEQKTETSITAQPRYASQYTSSYNRIAELIKWLAWITMILGFIMGWVMSKSDVFEFFGYGYDDRVWGVAIYWWVSSIFAGIVLLGFSEVITILHDIRERQHAAEK